MRTSRYAPPAILLLVLLAAAPALSVTSQSLLFGPEGNLLSDGSASIPASSASSPFSAPEGVALRGGIAYQYYPVYGATFSDIVASIKENGPYFPALKKRLPTKIAWRFSISYAYDYSSALDEDGTSVHVAVTVTDVGISYAPTLTLPSLIDNTSLNPFERTMWKDLWTRLLQHEYDHVDIIENAATAGQVKKQLADITYLIFDYQEDADIRAIVGSYLREQAEKAAGEMARTIRGRLKDYDTLTDYGNRHSLRDSFFNSDK